MLRDRFTSNMAGWMERMRILHDNTRLLFDKKQIVIRHIPGIMEQVIQVDDLKRYSVQELVLKNP